MFDMSSVKTRYTRHPGFDPAEKYPGVQAITYEGMTIGEKRTKVFAYIGFPENAAAPVPGIVLVHGGGGHAFAEWVKMWVDRGYAAIAMDTVGHFPDDSGTGWRHGLYGEFAREGYTNAPDNSEMRDVADDNLDRQWMYHAVADVMIARRILAADARVDASNIGMTGISWGGIIAAIMLGYESEFAFAVPVYGSGYLSDLTLGKSAIFFQTEQVRRRWLAERRFDRVKTPTLWLCWNDDNNFSIQANSRTYLDTCGGNPYTTLSIVDDLMHSHEDGWKRPEIETFANAVVSGTPLPRVLSQPSGRDFCFEIADADDAVATVYYITEPMSYSIHDKFGYGAYSFMDQRWQTRSCSVENGCVRGSLPADAAGYYVELKTIRRGGEYVLTSVYVELES